MVTHCVVDEPCRSEESEYLTCFVCLRILGLAVHSSVPSVVPVTCLVGPVVIVSFLDEIHVSISLRVDVNLTVNNPRCCSSLLSYVPKITEVSYCSVALFLQLSSSLLECIPRTGSAANSLLNLCRIIRTENFLSDGSRVDHSTTSALIAKSNQLTVCVSTKIDCVLSDLSILQLTINVVDEVSVRSCERRKVTLCIRQNVVSLCSNVDVRSTVTASCQSSVQLCNVSAVCVSRYHSCYLVLGSHVRVISHETLNHARNLRAHREHVDLDGTSTVALNSCGNFCCGVLTGSLSLAAFSRLRALSRRAFCCRSCCVTVAAGCGLVFFLVLLTASKHSSAHCEAKNTCNYFFHIVLLIFVDFRRKFRPILVTTGT